MSTDPEDSLLEEALRQDLPTADTQTRVRRRLLAAGVAVGNGMAVGSAAAAGASSGAATGVGMASKALAMSWGVKLGVLAAVAVPALGLLVENRAASPMLSAPPPVARKATELSPARPAPGRDRAPDAAAALSPAALGPLAAEPAPAFQRAPVSAPAALMVAAPTPTPARAESAPQASRGNFAPAEAAPPAKVASTLADETRLLDGAFAELAAGNTSRAAELLSEHERRFPQGLLVKERQRAKLRLSEISRGESEGGRK